MSFLDTAVGVYGQYNTAQNGGGGGAMYQFSGSSEARGQSDGAIGAFNFNPGRDQSWVMIGMMVALVFVVMATTRKR